MTTPAAALKAATTGCAAFDPLAGPHARLAERLEELSVVTPYLPHLGLSEIHDHVDGVRTYLHDDVLPQAHSEEVALLPVLDRLGARGARLGAAMTIEHDTVRDAVETLDDVASEALGTRQEAIDRHRACMPPRLPGRHVGMIPRACNRPRNPGLTAP